MNEIVTDGKLIQSTSPDGFRIYLDKDQREYISCTTLLGIYEDKAGLIAWQNKLGLEEADRQRDLAAERGTSVHLDIERYLHRGNEPSLLPFIPESNFAKHAIDSFYGNVEALEMESMISYRNGPVGFAGQFDSMVRMPANSYICDGEILPELVVISDLKTKKAAKPVQQQYIFKHLLQLSAYVIAKEIQSGISIDGAVIVFTYPRSSKTYFLSRHKINHYWSIFESLLNDYFKIKPLTMTWQYMIAQSEYKWNDEYGIFESYAPSLMTKVPTVEEQAD